MALSSLPAREGRKKRHIGVVKSLRPAFVLVSLKCVEIVGIGHIVLLVKCVAASNILVLGAIVVVAELLGDAELVIVDTNLPK